MEIQIIPSAGSIKPCDEIDVVSFSDNLLVCETENKQKVINSYKITTSEGKAQLQKHRQVKTVDDNYFVFHSLDINRTVIITFKKKELLVHDFEDGSLLATTKKKTYEFIVWKNNYLITSSLLVMSLEPTKQTSEEYKCPYQVVWRKPKVEQQYWVLNFFNVDNKFLIRFISGYTVECSVWNEHEKLFEPHSLTFENLNQLIAGIFAWNNKFFVLMQQDSYKNFLGQEFWVYDLHGRFLYKQNIASRFVFVWNNFLVSVEKEPLEAKSALKFLDGHGKVRQKFQIRPVKNAFVWNTRLVLFYQDSMVDVLQSKNVVLLLFIDP